VPLEVKTKEPKKKLVRDLFEGKALGYLTERERIKSFGHFLKWDIKVFFTSSN